MPLIRRFFLLLFLFLSVFSAKAETSLTCDRTVKPFNLEIDMKGLIALYQFEDCQVSGNLLACTTHTKKETVCFPCEIPGKTMLNWHSVDGNIYRCE